MGKYRPKYIIQPSLINMGETEYAVNQTEAFNKAKKMLKKHGEIKIGKLYYENRW